MSATAIKVLTGARAVSADFYPYTIDNSARFDVGSSPYLSRTLGTSGNQKTWTISYWYKPVSVASWYYQFSTGNSTDFTYIAHTASTSTYGFRLLQNVGNLTQVQMQPTRLLRDTSAWYHIVWAIDTTQATTANRVRLYINGVEETSWQVATYPSQNYNFYWGKNSSVHYVGNHLGNYSNGYMAQVALVFGSQLTPSNFAESKNGVWIPKDITGLSYGAEGSLLAFQDSASLGDDTSGNTNDYASSGLTSSDQMIDTPTNNFNTVNPLYYSPTVPQPTPSEGNLRIASNILNTRLSPTTVQLPLSGKYYWEIYIDGTPNSSNWIGISNTREIVEYNNAQFPGQYAGLGHQIWDTTSKNDGASITYGVGQSNGNIYQVAIDMDTGKAWFGSNNTWFSSGDPANGTNPGKTFTDLNVIATFSTYSTGCKYDLNFGQNGTFNGKVTAQGNADANGVGDFYYAPPTGFLATCTANFPEPTIGPNSTTTSDENFNTVLYTGTGASRSVSVGFQPDFVWLKDRTTAYNHYLYDVIRGVGNALQSNSTGYEETGRTGLTSFDSGGFSLGSQAGDNASGDNFVSWVWKGNGSGVSNTNGSVTSTVSANTNAGFSIVTYTGSSSGISVGHGLSSAPEMIIWKARGTPNGSARSWIVWTKDLTSTNYILYLNQSSGQTNVTAGSVLSGSPTATTFSLGTEPSVNWNAENYVAYCFHSVEGFSSFGKYTGNGSADGPFVYTGHSVAYLLIKALSGAENWVIYDTARDTYNELDSVLYTNSSNAEFSGTTVNTDALSNGFKPRDTWSAINGSGTTYIYIAFAENPFKYSNAR